MQVTCLRENLSRGLSNISRAVAARATLPVTQNVLLEADNGQLKLTATNTEISPSTWIGAQIEGEGAGRRRADHHRTCRGHGTPPAAEPAPTLAAAIQAR